MSKFERICDGYGFVEVEQTGDGFYCFACLTTHKRPTKMYSNSAINERSKDHYCRRGVIILFDDGESFEN